MLRKLWFGRAADISDDVVRPGEMGAAPFALVVEYDQDEKGRYVVRMRIRVRNEETLDVIAQHKLWDTEVYVDREAVQAAEERKALTEGRALSQDQNGAGYAFGPLHYFLVREGWAWWKERQTVRISFRTLYEGIAVHGDMNSCARLGREISMQIDRLAAQLDTGRAFTGGQLRVYAPGNRVKPAKGAGVSPKNWGKR